GCCVELNFDRPGDGKWLSQEVAGVDEHVFPALHRPLIYRSRHRRCAAAVISTSSRYRLFGIIAVAVGASFRRFLKSELAVAAHRIGRTVARQIKCAVFRLGNWPVRLAS